MAFGAWPGARRRKSNIAHFATHKVRLFQRRTQIFEDSPRTFLRMLVHTGFILCLVHVSIMDDTRLISAWIQYDQNGWRSELRRGGGVAAAWTGKGLERWDNARRLKRDEEVIEHLAFPHQRRQDLWQAHQGPPRTLLRTPGQHPGFILSLAPASAYA
jgi:hypothetical protein